MLGIATARAPERVAALRHARASLGATPGGLEAFLALRGLRTMAVRLERGQASAAVLAERLAAHPAVSAVHYPGLPGDPGHDRAARLMDGFGAMLAFEVAAGAEAAQAVAERVRVIVHATSLGGVETLIERRARYEYEATPEALLRLSVGVEHVEDLWADLEAAIETACIEEGVRGAAALKRDAFIPWRPNKRPHTKRDRTFDQNRPA